LRLKLDGMKVAVGYNDIYATLH